MNRVNYQKKLDEMIEQFKEQNLIPHVLIHSCCARAVVMYLSI